MKCNKIIVGWGFVPDPTRVAYSGSCLWVIRVGPVLTE